MDTQTIVATLALCELNTERRQAAVLALVKEGTAYLMRSFFTEATADNLRTVVLLERCATVLAGYYDEKLRSSSPGTLAAMVTAGAYNDEQLAVLVYAEMVRRSEL